MFVLDLPAVPYADPWNQPLSERMAVLCRSKRRVAYFYEVANNSTFRYRAYNMAQVLNENLETDISASYFFLTDYAYFDELAEYADVLVICRSRYSAQLNHLIAKFRSRRKRVLFDVDDLVFDPQYAHLIVNTLGLNVQNEAVWDDFFAMISRMGRTLQLCDGAITTNEFLAARIADFSGLPVSVVPNFMNREQIAVSNLAYSKKERQEFKNDGRVCLGYFSGSPSHRLDYALLEPALNTLMEQRPEVDLMVVGYIDADGLSEKFGQRIKRAPFQDYVNLQLLIANVEFNLMPLQSNTFTDCKSELKYFESASVGTLSVASPGNTYRSAIQNGKNGYLSKAHDWLEVLNFAIDALPNYAEMARLARTDVLQRFIWNRFYNPIVMALGF